MNRLLTQAFLVTLLLSKVYAQIDPTELEKVSKFIPNGYSVLRFAQGDLNNDNIDDLILVLNKKGEESLSTSEHPLKRKLLILIEQPDTSYILAAQNENVVYYYNYDPNFKDAFVDLNIKKGMFSIDHYGGFAQRWGRTTVFKYNASAKKWYLTKYAFETFESTDIGKTTKEKTYTVRDFGNTAFENFDIYKERKSNN